jgi:hypothetical protein
MIEGDNQNGPNAGRIGNNDSHLIVWDADTNTDYEFFEAARPTENASGFGYTPVSGNWNAAEGAVFNMAGDNFRTLGEVSAEADGLAILSDLPRVDEVVSQAHLPAGVTAQMSINHALPFTLVTSLIKAQSIYPASHEFSGTGQLPLGTRLRLKASVDIASWQTTNPESFVLAQAMQQYGLILTAPGPNMFFSAAPAAIDSNNLPMIDPTTKAALQWDLSDIVSGIQSLPASDFEVVDLTPQVTSLSTNSGPAGLQITVTGQNFLGAAGHLQVLFVPPGNNPPWTTTGPSGNRTTTLNAAVQVGTGLTIVDSSHLMINVPNGLSGTVDVRVLSGQLLNDNLGGDAANVTAPIFGYGISAIVAGDQFTLTPLQVPPSPRNFLFTYRREYGFGGFTQNNPAVSIGAGDDAGQLVGQSLLNPTLTADVNVNGAQAAGLAVRIQGNDDAYVAVLTSTGQAMIGIFDADTNTITPLAPPVLVGTTFGTLTLIVTGGANPVLSLLLNSNPVTGLTNIQPAGSDVIASAGGLGIFAQGPGGSIGNLSFSGS